MQIGWVEQQQKRETQQQKFGKFWLIQALYDFFLILMPPSQEDSATICDVTTVQLSNGTVHKFHFSWKYIFPLCQG